MLANSRASIPDAFLAEAPCLSRFPTARRAGDRYSFRTDELLTFMARGFAARLDALETAR